MEVISSSEYPDFLKTFIFSSIVDFFNVYKVVAEVVIFKTSSLVRPRDSNSFIFVLMFSGLYVYIIGTVFVILWIASLLYPNSLKRL